MVDSRDKLIEDVNHLIDKEVDDLNSIMGILNDDESVTDSESVSSDINIIKTKVSTLNNVKGLIKKASLNIKGIDNEKIMSVEEKKILYKLVRFIMFFRKIFRIK